MAPRPPKVRPHPAKIDGAEKTPVKPAEKSLKLEADKKPVAFLPRVAHIEPPRKHEHGSAHQKPRGSDGDATQRRARSAMRRLPSVIKRSAISDRKFYPQEGALTGSEIHGEGAGLKRDTLYHVPLGGLEEVGRNCSFFEYNDEIVIIDMGIQFPAEETPGVDWIIPNTNYLEKKKKNIRGLIITHAHYDHFGAVPYVLEKLGNPVIYGTELIKALLEKRLAEMPNVPKMKFHVIKNHDRVRISPNFTAEFFGVAHTVPDSSGVLLETPVGNMATCGDFRLEYDANGKLFNTQEFEWLNKQGVHTLLLDSTNAHEDGHTVSEEVVINNIEKMLREAEGRIILSTFASMIARLAEVINVAEKIGRKVAINGRSMKDNLEIAKQLGYLKYKEGTTIPVEEIHKYPDNKILILSTGAMGQENAGLMRIINGEHKYIRIKPGDTVIFSSSVIPGSERGVQILKDNFSRQKALVHTNDDLDIHSSGHAPGPDLAIVADIVKPKFVIPIHGHVFMRAANIENMKKIGMTANQVVILDNGQVIEITKDNILVTTKNIDAFYVMVDGLGVGDVEAVVVRDRKLLAQEGMVVVIMVVDRKNGRLIKNPDVISRGFIYLKDNTSLIEEMRAKIKIILNQTGQSKQAPEPDYLKGLIRDQIGLFLYSKTNRRPMILPVMIEI